MFQGHLPAGIGKRRFLFDNPELDCHQHPEELSTSLSRNPNKALFSSHSIERESYAHH